MPFDTPAVTQQRRDPTIDIIRGLWIISMTSGHLAPGTLIDDAIHMKFVDGASGFILMSGLVLGMVQPGRISRGGVRNAVTLLLKRARLLYFAQICSVLAALVAGFFALNVAWFPRFGDFGGVVNTFIQILFLQVNPANLNILSLYVILIVLAAIAVPLLNAGKAWIVAAASFALYAFGFAFPVFTTLPAGNHDAINWNFNWGTWQFLFLTGLIVGYYWKRKGLGKLIESWRVFGVTVALVAVTSIGGTLFATMGVVPSLVSLASGAFAKSDLGPGRFVLAWGAFAILYFVIKKATARFTLSWLWPIETIGRRSLDSFLILTGATILIPAVANHVVTGPITTLLTLITLLVMLGWISFRYGKDGKRRVATGVRGERTRSVRRTRPVRVTSE